ncbi:MAG: Coq4 family protein [Myxococcaceae bacterium]
MDLALISNWDLPFFVRAWTVLRAMKRLDDNPGDRAAQRAFMLCLDRHDLENRLAYLRSTEDGRALLRARPTLDERQLSVAKLMTYPEGSFGRAMASFFTQWKIEPFPASDVTPRDEIEWVAQRVADSHDCLHVAAGYGADSSGEVEVHAFMWAQWKPPTTFLVLLFGIAMSVWAIGVRKTWQRFWAAWRRGKQSPFVEDAHWERLLPLPLEEVRARLGLR